MILRHLTTVTELLSELVQTFHYDRLTPEDRFRLVVEAMARGDEQEVERLVNSCPREAYKMNELSFSNRVRASQEITMALCFDLTAHLAKLQAIEAHRESLSRVFSAFINEAVLAYLDGHEAGFKRGWEAAGKTGVPAGVKGVGRRVRRG